MWQSAIAGRVGLTRATINCILRRSAATGTLVPGNSTGTPRKTTSLKDCALFMIVRQDHFINARALTMRNLYGMKVSRKTNRHNLTMAHWQHVNFGDESRFQLYSADSILRVCRLPGECFQQSCQAHEVQTGGGSVQVWEAFDSGTNSSLVLQNNYLTGELYRNLLRNTLVQFATQHFGDTNDNTTPQRARVFLASLQQGNVTKM